MDDCIEWQGYRNQAGYGIVRWGGAVRKAHRRAWAQVNGPIPDGLFVLHRCDNPPCVNVSHLFLGTHADNMADRNAKGRQARVTGERHGTHTHPERVARGERLPQSVLTACDIPAIRARVAAGESPTSVARMYGVSHRAITKVISGKTWSHVG